MRRSTPWALVAALLLGGCGTTDTNPSAPTDQALGRQGGHEGRFHDLEIVLLPPCDTVGQPPDTIPTDTIPTDTIPTDTIPSDTGGVPTLRSLLHQMGGANHGSGGRDESQHRSGASHDSHHGSGGSHGSDHRHHRPHRMCIGETGGDGRHGSHWFDGWRRWFGDGTFGFIKIPAPADSDTTVSLRTKLHEVAPNRSYLVQWAADTIADHVCSDSSWVTVGLGSLQSIVADSNGNARQTLTEGLPSLPPHFSVDLRFRVIDSATTTVALVSRCHSFTTR